MATYVNDLRLKEISTGDESGTWGTSTNTNLELIGEALGYATQQVFSSDADATTTVADGASDPARAMYFKITSAGNLTATRTCTIAPNTVSRVMFIENATSGSQSIAISQGSGANVTIATGKTAVVYLDGAGAGAAVVDAMAGVDPGVTDTLAEVLAAGNATGGTDIAVGTGDDITFADNSKAIFGAGSDLQIYHDPSAGSIIQEAGAGSLFVRASTNIQLEGVNGENMAIFNENGSVQLYYDNAEKLATSNTGITVTGDIVLGDTNPTITMNDSSVTNLQHLITSSSDRLIIAADNNDVSAGTKIELYVDGTERMVVTTTGIGIGTSSPSASIDVVSSGTNSQNIAEFSSASGIRAEISTDAQDDAYMYLYDSADAIKVAFRTDGNASYINGGGNVGIGTDSPGRLLELKESSTGAGDAIIRLRGNGNNADNTPLGSLEWFNADSSGAQPGVVAAVEAQSANSNGHMGKLLFKTHDGSGSEADPPTTRMIIDQSGNVGIGTVSPAANLDIVSSNATLHLTDSDDNTYAELRNNGGTLTIGSDVGASANGSSINFKVDNTEAMRIDSSGNLLVGKTALGTSVRGVEARANGLLLASRSGGEPLILDRTTSDGTIVDLRKDSTTVGSIGTEGGNLYIEGSTSTGKTGIEFSGAEWFPRESGANVDGVTSLGSSLVRFKDLYLSGTATTGGLTVEADSGGGGGSTTPVVAVISDTDGGSSWVSGTIFAATDYKSGDGSGAGSGVRVRTGIAQEASSGSTSSYIVQTAPTTAGTMVDRLKINSYGDISFYSSDGTSQSLFWDASAESLGIGTTSPDTGLDVATTNYTFSGTTYDIYGLFGDTSGGIRLGADSSNDDSVIGTTGTNNLQFVTYNGSAWGSRMTLDNTGKVGIGTSTPTGLLHLSSSAPAFYMTDTTNNTEGVISMDNAGSLILNADLNNEAGSSNIRFAVDGSEAMRIDASGNLLVGKTSTGAATAGIELNGANDLLRIARDGGVLQELNRITSDGDLIDFRKDNTTVGSIGVDSSDNLYITASATNHVGIYMGGGGILPMNSGSLDSSDNVDIGSPNYQFVDLYLSGGAYLGGTAAANKLDDYEEGTWTPTINVGTVAAAQATYTKIGNIVSLRALLGDISDNTSATNISIGGLPYTAASSNRSAGSSMFRYFSRTDAAQINPYIGESASTMEFYWSFNSSSGWDVVQFDDGTQANMDFILEISYMTA